MDYHRLYDAYNDSKLNRIGREINEKNPDLANKGGSGDKGDHHHDYLDYYEYLFRSFGDSAFSLLEIGINMGYSITTWLKRYPNVRVTGIDIDLTNWKGKEANFRLSPSEISRLTIIEGDATQSPILNHLSDTYDVILDDGSHANDDMIRTFELLFPTKLKRRGIYIVEDVHCYDQMNGFLNYVQSLFPFVYKSKSWKECKMLSGASTIQEKINEDWRFSIKEIIIHRDIIVFTKE